jgi:hypothetical protein
VSADVAARVAAGIAELDRVDPDWFHRISLDQFDIHSGVYRPDASCGCVLAQLNQRQHAARTGFYEDGAAELLGKDVTHDLDWLVDHGFTLPRWDGSSSVDGPWAELEQAWRDAITARRAAS